MGRLADGVNKSSVLVLTSTFPRWKGDAEPTFVFELCRRLSAYFEIHVVAPHAPGCATYETFEGLHIHRFPYFFMCWERLAYQGGILANIKKQPLLRFLIPFFLMAQLVCAVRLLKQSEFQLVHAHWIFPQGLVALWARSLTRSSSRILCTAHGGDLYGLKGGFFERVKRQVVNRCDHMTVVSHAMHSDLLGLNTAPQDVSVIPMGVDLRHRFVPRAGRNHKGLLLFVGRLVEKKGLRYLLEAMPIILKTHPDTRLRIAGDGPDRPAMEKLALGLGLRNHVEFLGAVSNDDLPGLYQDSGILVFPSVVARHGDREGFGLVLVEALGCECAVVTTGLAAMRDIVQNGETGWVVEQKSPEQIAHAVICLINKPELGRGLARNGRNHVLSRFDWETVAEKYAALMRAMG